MRSLNFLRNGRVRLNLQRLDYEKMEKRHFELSSKYAMGIIFALDSILASIFCLGVFSDHVFDLPLGCMVTQNRVVLSPIITSNREFNAYAH